jgi:hypothetical protein
MTCRAYGSLRRQSRDILPGFLADEREPFLDDPLPVAA